MAAILGQWNREWLPWLLKQARLGSATNGDIAMATTTVHPNHQLISSEDVEGANVYGLDDARSAKSTI